MQGSTAAAERLRQALFQTRVDLPKDQGLVAVTRGLSRRLADVARDRGIDTSERAVELEHFHPERVWYVPSDWRDLRRALSDWQVRSTDVFVDFGSGKGRVVYEASRYPFSRVIGVEISENLNNVARRNIDKKARRLACGSIELVTADASGFEIPDEMTVAYFFHPFGGRTFERVIDNIVRSVEKCPRKVRVIYQIPLMEDYVLSTGRFKLLRTTKHEADDLRRIAIYETE